MPVVPGPAGPVGIRPGTGGPAARRPHHAAAAAAGALPVLPPDPRVLLPSWCAPRRADGIEVIGAAAGLAMAGHGHRPIAVALGVPAATVRGWLRRLRARAGQLRAHAIGELNGLGFYPPGPPSKPCACRKSYPPRWEWLSGFGGGRMSWLLGGGPLAAA